MRLLSIIAAAMLIFTVTADEARLVRNYFYTSVYNPSESFMLCSIEGEESILPPLSRTGFQDYRFTGVIWDCSLTYDRELPENYSPLYLAEDKLFPLGYTADIWYDKWTPPRNPVHPPPIPPIEDPIDPPIEDPPPEDPIDPPPSDPPITPPPDLPDPRLPPPGIDPPEDPPVIVDPPKNPKPIDPPPTDPIIIVEQPIDWNYIAKGMKVTVWLANNPTPIEAHYVAYLPSVKKHIVFVGGNQEEATGVAIYDYARLR